MPHFEKSAISKNAVEDFAVLVDDDRNDLPVWRQKRFGLGEGLLVVNSCVVLVFPDGPD